MRHLAFFPLSELIFFPPRMSYTPPKLLPFRDTMEDAVGWLRRLPCVPVRRGVTTSLSSQVFLINRLFLSSVSYRFFCRVRTTNSGSRRLVSSPLFDSTLAVFFLNFGARFRAPGSILFDPFFPHTPHSDF